MSLTYLLIIAGTSCNYDDYVKVCPRFNYCPVSTCIKFSTWYFWL